MNLRRYLATMASSWMIAAGAVIGLNLLVDAIGILPVSVVVAGVNDQKPFRGQHDWIAKRFDVWRHQPATIIMGSSRIKQAVDPRLLAGTAFAPAYNGAMNASADFREIRSYLRRHFEADKNLRYVVIEAFPSALLAYSDPRLSPKRRVPNDLADYASIFFSMSGLSTSIRTVSLNLGEKAGTPPTDEFDHGFAPIPLATHHFSVRNVFNFILHKPILHRGLSLPSEVVEAARQIVEDCRFFQVECRFFLSPLHADALLAIYHLGLWPELEKLKRVLAELGPTFDFTRYNGLIDERIGSVVYWPEAFHFSPAMGELMTKTMAGQRPPDLPDNFGVVLDTRNVEASLSAWREERDTWMARNPNVLERMRRAEENFRSGISFKDVTSVELAAGGW